MVYFIIILSFLLIFISSKYILYRRQISDICRQMDFIRENETNIFISSDIMQSEILSLIDNINELNERHRREKLDMRKKDMHLKAALTNVSHDIRTPLTSLKGYFELLSGQEDEGKKKEYMAVIDGKLKELTELLDELFTYTRLKNEEYKIEIRKYDFTKLVLEIIFSFYGEFKKRGIKPELDICEESLFISCNETAVRRILSNIIKNAILHGNGMIKMHYRIIAGGIEFICENNIENSDNIDISQVFDRFYKADDARSKVSTGLGLAIANELTERIGGNIRAECKDNIFIIILTFRE